MQTPSTPAPLPRRVLRAVVGVALVAGTAAALFYARHQLTLSHYDAKAHLVVARRVFDSLTPGWKQVGAVWLPLPHLLNLLPVQIDVLYRTGASGVAISIASFGIACGALAWLVFRFTGSVAAVLTTTVVFAGDPNVLYLQSTPMTEPLLFALLTSSVAALVWWTDVGGAPAQSWRPGSLLALACMTRYEAWPVTAAALAASCLVLFRGRHSMADVARRVARVACWPALAVLLFVVNSRVSTGAWFVTGDFFVPENDAHGRPLIALSQVATGLIRLVGPLTVAVGAAGALVALWRAARHARDTSLAIGFALAATAALPFYAFLQGHPFRIRYMVVLVLSLSVMAGVLVGALPRRLRALAAALVCAIGLVETPPLDQTAAMITEAQWDRPASRARAAVTACLARDFVRPREKVLASMGSLAHYMQELSRAGFRLDDFVHEGTDDIWPDAVDAPLRHVQWILFDEFGEGGDFLTHRRQQFPDIVRGFERVCEGGGVALYRRTPRKDIALGAE